jgi:hypothetical protein
VQRREGRPASVAPTPKIVTDPATVNKRNKAKRSREFFLCFFL